MKKLTKTTLISLATLTALSLGALATCDTDVDMGGHNIINVARPKYDNDVATKKYVDDKIAELNLAYTERYTRDDVTETVTDHTMGLMWQDNADIADVYNAVQWLRSDDYTVCMDAINQGEEDPIRCKIPYHREGTALEYCSHLELGGFSDWVLPDSYELASLLNDDIRKNIIFRHLQNDVDYYWSRDTFDYKFSAKVVSFLHGSESALNKNEYANVCCVRSID